MTSLQAPAGVSPASAKAAGFFSDVRHGLLAVLAAVIIVGASTPSRTMVLVAIVLAVPDMTSRHDWRPEFWAGALAFTLWASIIWSENSALSSRIFMDQAIVAVMFVAYRVALTNRRALLLIGVGYLVGCGLLIRRVLEENLAASLSFQASASARYTVEGVNANYIAFTLAGGVAVAILLGQLDKRWLVLLISVGVLCWAGILLNDTRAAMIAAGSATAWWLVIRERVRRTALRALVVTVLAIATGIVTGALDNQLRSFFTSAAERDAGGLNGRLDFWPLARDVFFDHPLFGIGAGAVARHLPHGVFAHNVFLDVGTSAGLVGIVALLGALYAILFRATRDLMDSRRYMLIGVAICATAAPLLAGYWYQTAPFWLLLAMFSRVGVLTRPGAASPTRTV